jgi:DNA-directed RNA polymerase specialized sigma24 family protein
MPGSPQIERKAAPAPALDLRRGFRRDVAQRLVERAAHLPAPDRCLVEGVFRDGRSIAELAELWPENPKSGRGARALRRRLHRLIERLNSPGFLLVAECRERWGPTRRRVATACILHGLSHREAADSLGISLHTVRRHFAAVIAITEALRGGAAP